MADQAVLTEAEQVWAEEVMGLLGLTATPVAGPPEVEEAIRSIPLNIVALGRARIGWINARRRLMSEMTRLKGVVLAMSKTDEDHEGIAASVDDLFAPLQSLDDRLEAALEDLVETPEGPERTRAKNRAASLAAQYRAQLDTPFFQEIDDNPFAPVAVRSTAASALTEIETALRG